jgi:integrase
MASKDKGIREVRPGVWELTVSLGFNVNTGKYDRNIERFTGTITGARKRRGEMLAAAGQKLNGKVPDVSLNTVIHEWLDALLVQERSPNTILAYQRRIKVLRDKHGELPVRNLTTAHLNAMYVAMLKEGLKGNTVKGFHRAFSALLGWAMKQDGYGLTENVAMRTNRPKGMSGHIRFPSSDQLRQMIRLAQASRNPVNATILIFTADTGMRSAEVAALRWTEVDLEGARVEVMRTIVACSIEREATKTGRSRTVSLSGPTVEALRRHRITQEKVAEACGITLSEDAFVFSFLADGSEPIRPGTLSYMFRRLAMEVGFRYRVDGELRTGTFYSLRHFMVTQSLAAGRSIHEVANRAGHSVKTMSEVYSHYLPDADRGTANAMGAVLDDILGDQAMFKQLRDEEEL